MAGEKDAYQVVKCSGKRKDSYRWSRLFLSYAEIRKYRNVLTREKPITDMEDAVVKAEDYPQVKASHLEILVRSQKAKSELLTAAEKSSVCFLRLSCV